MSYDESEFGSLDFIVSLSSDFPSSREYSNITVMPFDALIERGVSSRFHIGGPVWPAWESAGLARIHAGDDDFYGPVDARPDPSDPELFFAGDHFYWIGPISHHFGHQVRDFSSRLLPSLLADPKAILVFGARQQPRSRDDVEPPAWFADLIRWFGVSIERTFIVTRPTRFATLHVVAQPEWAGPNPDGRPPHPDYIAALTHLTEQNLGLVPRCGVTLVARSRATPLILGEAVLDGSFTSAGHRVLHPQELPLHEQLYAYAAAEKLVFSEGSALHGLQLLGRVVGEVVVLQRRHGFDMSAASLHRATRHTSVDAIISTLPMDSPISPSQRLAIVDFDLLINRLRAAGIDVDPVDADHLRREQQKQLRSWSFDLGRALADSQHVPHLSLLRSILASELPGRRRAAVALVWNFLLRSTVSRIRRLVRSPST